MQTTGTFAQMQSYQTAARNLIRLHELERLALALQPTETPVIVLKGMALVGHGVRTLTERSMCDIDMLVQEQHLDSAEAALVSLGYDLKVDPREDGPFPSDLTGVKKYTRYVGQMLIAIELHWHLCNVEWFRRLMALDEEALWAEARSLRVGEATLLQLSSADMLLHLCLHVALHNFAHTTGYQDIACFLEYERPFPWDVFLERARRFRLQTAAFFPLEVAVEALGVEVPVEVMEALRPPRWRRWCVYRVADPRKMLNGEAIYSQAHSYLIHLLISDRLVDVFHMLVWMFFPGWRWLSERYHTKRVWRTLGYGLLHPILVLREGIQALARVFREKRAC